MSALTQIVTYVVRPTATYRAIELDVPAAWLGALGASYAIVPLALALPSGALTDRWGERRVAIAGGFVLCASSVCFVLAGQSVSGLMVGSMLLGTGQLLCVVAQQALVANSSEFGRFDAAFGRYTFAASLGQAIGPALIIAFGGSQRIPDTGAIFVASIVMCGVLTGLSFGLGRTHHARSRPGSAGAATIRTLFRIPSLPRALITSCIILAAVDITLIYLPALGAERGMTASLIGVLLAIRAASSMVSRLFLGWLSAQLGRRRLLVVSTLAAALSTAVVPLPMPIGLLAAVMIVMGLGLGVGQPVTMAWLAEASPPGMRGRSMSLRLIGNRAGQLLIPSAVGVVAAGLGAAGVLWCSAAALAGVSFAARRITQNPTPQEP
ncbi:MAG TPA: MFS transporter [Propionibacteriaceae bacterium]|nr:MFS transporter [Propionibacteriaceae bacterium]